MNLHLLANATPVAVDGSKGVPGAAPLTLRRLDVAGFAPFGRVIDVPPAATGRPINGGTSMRFDLVDDMRLDAQGGRPQLAIFRAQARSFPHRVTELERHSLGSQSFIPLGELRFVLVVAPANAAGMLPQSSEIVAFISNGRQGVMLSPGTWHHALLAVDAGDFAVIERVGDEVDCDVCTLDVAAEVRL